MCVNKRACERDRDRDILKLLLWKQIMISLCDLQVANWIVEESALGVEVGNTSLESSAKLIVIQAKNRYSQPRDQVCQCRIK